LTVDLGDRAVNSIIDFKFSTTFTDGVPTLLAGTPACSVYKSNSTTQTTVGVTLTTNFDGMPGCNHVNIDTSADAFYTGATDYEVVLTAGTVGGISVFGMVVATFSITNRVTTALTAAGIRTAVGLSTNDLGSRLDTITTSAASAASSAATGATSAASAATSAASASSSAATAVTQTTATAIRADVGLTSADLNTQLGGIATATAAGAIRTAIGLTAADLNTRLDAILARTPDATAIGHMNTVYDTDFATNYNTTTHQWNTSSVFTLADGGLTAAKFADGCLTNAKFANAAIDARVIADGTIDGGTLSSSALDVIAGAVAEFTHQVIGAVDSPDEPTLAEAISWIYKLAVCRKDNNGDYSTFYALGDNSSAEQVQSVSEADGTVNKGRILAGP
jgi:hypothetical protein